MKSGQSPVATHETEEERPVKRVIVGLVFAFGVVALGASITEPGTALAATLDVSTVVARSPKPNGSVTALVTIRNTEKGPEKESATVTGIRFIDADSDADKGPLNINLTKKFLIKPGQSWSTTSYLPANALPVAVVVEFGEGNSIGQAIAVTTAKDTALEDFR